MAAGWMNTPISDVPVEGNVAPRGLHGTMLRSNEDLHIGPQRSFGAVGAQLCKKRGRRERSQATLPPR
jgi:hypothetical protein